MSSDKINRNIEVTLMCRHFFCMLQNSSNSSPGQSDTSQSVEEFAESLGYSNNQGFQEFRHLLCWNNQGAEGARAFDDLVALVRQIGELGSDKEWETTVVQALMTSKQYLKGDYKVM